MTQDPQKRVGYNESWMKTHLPRTYLYLLQFKDNLLSRKSRVLSKDPFYSLYGVNSDTFASFKVIWGRVANEVKACVVSIKDDKYLGRKPLVPFEAMMIPFSDGDESFYVCALINSSPARLTIRAYIVLHPDTHVLDNIQIPKYEEQNSLHRELSQLSQKAHKLAAKGEEAKAELKMVEEEIDQKAAELWGITEEELNDIKNSLKELS